MAETTTIVSSTNKPSASKNANNVRKLIDMPKNCMKKNADRNYSVLAINIDFRNFDWFQNERSFLIKHSNSDMIGNVWDIKVLRS